VATIDQQIAHHKGLAKGNSSNWFSLNQAASLWLRRARLTGSYDDYAAAEALLDRAFRTAPPTTGPIATRLALNLSLHRLGQVPRDLEMLDAMPLLSRPKPRLLELWRGNYAFQVGDYAAARRSLEGAVELKRNFPALSSLALTYWKTADFETAEGLYREALGSYHGGAAEPVAWAHLQLGLMDLDRGRWADALAHYEDAASVLSGWYLVDEHIAEVLLLQGRIGEAEAIYLRVVQSTGNPEFMDALAGLEQGRGNERATADWIAQAEQVYVRHLKRFPEASWGHALEHYSEFGPVDRALELATRNHALRPNAGAKTELAAIHLTLGQTEQAVALIEEALASPYRSARLHSVAAEVFERSNRGEKAAEQERAALAMNPHILD
jgi:tetratricopeptide (TPR) repeat protein